MKKIKIFLLVLIFVLPLVSNAQNKGFFGFYDKKDKNQFLAICALQLVSGAARGYEQVVAYHYGAFKRVHPNANDRYFNPAISWKNKYEDGDASKGEKFPLSTSALVWTTDFKHLMDVTSDMPCYVSIVLPLTIKHGQINYKQILARLIGVMTCRAVAFNTVYSVIYKN